MDKLHTITAGGVGFLSSVVVEDFISPQLNMSNWAGAITQLLIAIVTVVGLFKKKKN